MVFIPNKVFNCLVQFIARSDSGTLEHYRNPAASADLANLGLFQTLHVAPISGLEQFQILHHTNY